MADAHEIAAWRFEQIAPLVDPSLDPGLRLNAIRERCKQRVVWPLSDARRRRGLPPKKKPIPKSTLYRWVQAFTEHGYDGLLPKRRADRGTSRSTDMDTWISYAVGLLYEQPYRTLTQLEVYLRLAFEAYDASRSTLHRHLHAHPAYDGVKRLRLGKKSKLRDLYETPHPHACWQMDGKGPFRVRLLDGRLVHAHVLSVLDDHSRAVLSSVVSSSESTEAAISVFQIAARRYGLPDRMQFDRGSAFDSHAFRDGVAGCGIHRNNVVIKNPEAQGKIEAYHRSLKRWFVRELVVQEVVDLDHLEELLRAMLAMLYNKRKHRGIDGIPEERLAGCVSPRRLSPEHIARAFFVHATAKSHPKTGEVKLPNGRFKVLRPHAGKRCSFLFDPLSDGAAFLRTHDGHEIKLEPFVKRPLLPPRPPASGSGQLQKLLDVWTGSPRPNAQPGFGLPEVFQLLGRLLQRTVPASEREAREILTFYRKHGPLPRDPFQKACQITANTLGIGRPLRAYLKDIERQIHKHDDTQPDHQPQENDT